MKEVRLILGFSLLVTIFSPGRLEAQSKEITLLEVIQRAAGMQTGDKLVFNNYLIFRNCFFIFLKISIPV